MSKKRIMAPGGGLPFLGDAVCWLAAIPAAVWLRFDFDTSSLDSQLLVPGLVAIGLQLAIGGTIGLYRGRWRYGSFEEVGALTYTSVSVGLAVLLLNWNLRVIPRSTPLLAMMAALAMQIVGRYVYRLVIESRHKSLGRGTRVVVVGAGRAGELLINMMRQDPQRTYVPVALVDDDPAKRNLILRGLQVAGGTAEIAKVAAAVDSDTAIIAMPSASAEDRLRIANSIEECGLKALSLPPMEQLFGSVDLSKIREVQPSDFLGRDPADIDPEAVIEYITDRTVLVTGAGGSIGSELCRQLQPFNPSRILMLDRDESGLHQTQLSLSGRGLLDDPNLILADIRDRERIEEVFETHRPDVVFHAAALKHLPLLEMHPGEGWKTNVLGTLNLLRAAERSGVRRFVNVSTDKAADPSCVLGYTKRITERLAADRGLTGALDCVSVRFGNVLGSNGSVLRAFETQFERGGPITVTHPEVTRYFMTVEEASRLVIFAGAIGSPGEILILDMGQPVRILDVAKQFANRATPPLRIEFTGLRSNEKLHEVLLADNERGERRVHPLITHVDSPPLKASAIEVVGAVDADLMAEFALAEATSGVHK